MLSKGKKSSQTSGRTSEIVSSEAERVASTVDQGVGGSINVNVLLIQAVTHAENPDKQIELTEKILEMTAKHERLRTELFKEQAAAVAEAKRNDPDEIEKRKNNGARRALKFVVGACAVGGIGGAVTVVSISGPLVVAGLLAMAGTMSIAMLGALASGESVSMTDIVRLVQAVKPNNGDSDPEPKDETTSKGKTGRRNQR